MGRNTGTMYFRQTHILPQEHVHQRNDQLGLRGRRKYTIQPRLQLEKPRPSTNKHLRFRCQSSKLVSFSPSPPATPIMIIYSHPFAITCPYGSNNCSPAFSGCQFIFCWQIFCFRSQLLSPLLSPAFSNTEHIPPQLSLLVSRFTFQDST